MVADSNSRFRERFWELPLDALSDSEWETLCDGCGRCCLKKFADEETEEIAWTRVVCRYFDETTSRCGCYSQRHEKVPECVDVKAQAIAAATWIPDTCAYKLRAQQKPLYSWHPLIAGSDELMLEQGISVRGKVVSEENVHPNGYYEHVIRWVESS